MQSVILNASVLQCLNIVILLKRPRVDQMGEWFGPTLLYSSNLNRLLLRPNIMKKSILGITINIKYVVGQVIVSCA